MYSIVRDMPTSGQFVRIWSFNDKIWSDTFRWFNIDDDTQNLCIFCHDTDEWESVDEFVYNPAEKQDETNVRFLIQGEE